MTRFWHPVADMATVAAAGELILERGEGVHVWDEDGRRYLDATGGLWYCNVGFGRDEIVDAAMAQMRRLPVYSHYGDVSSRSTTDLAERIARIAPMEDAAVFFASGGGDSIETAPLVAEQVQLNLPTRPLCREDCAGLCPRCGRNWNDGPCDCPPLAPDPRWAALVGWKQRNGRESG